MTYIDNNYRYKYLNWKSLNLYYCGDDTGFRLIQDQTHEHMYWIKNETFKSRNFYNLTNAKENAKLLYLTYKNSDEVDINKITLPAASEMAVG